MHPRLAAELQQAREADEVGRLMAENLYPMQKKNTTPLRQPRIQTVSIYIFFLYNFSITLSGKESRA